MDMSCKPSTGDASYYLATLARWSPLRAKRSEATSGADSIWTTAAPS